MTKDSKPGGDQTTEYKAGEVQKSGTALPDYHRLTYKQVIFLEAYAKSMGDINKAAKKAGAALRTVKETWLKQPKIQEEIDRIQEVWATTTLRMTAEDASARHIKLMDKMEKHLDDNESDTDAAAKVMNPLAKMSDTYLKATGKFNDDKGNSGVSVSINITKAKDEIINVEGEEIK